MSIDESTALRRRHRADTRFKIYTISALVVAALFLTVFLTDIVWKGMSAFWQTEVYAEITYNEETVAFPKIAVTDELQNIVSRGRMRVIPRDVEKDPSLMNTTKGEWVLTVSDVDQYLKDKPNRLKPDELAAVDALVDEGRIRVAFNPQFILRGDSNMPEMAGIGSAAVGSAFVLVLVLIFCFPIGVLTAIYLEEFAPDNRLTQIIEVNINNLAAIPSILFGLLGLALFINVVGVPRSSALVGGLTLSLMTLPVVIISSRAALRAVPDSIRKAAISMGATRWQAVVHHVLPQSMSGMLTGTIIGLSQAMGETAPLIIVGMIAFIPTAPETITDPTTVLPAQIYTWSTSSLRGFSERTAAGIMVLLFVLICVNSVAVFLRARFERRW